VPFTRTVTTVDGEPRLSEGRRAAQVQGDRLSTQLDRDHLEDVDVRRCDPSQHLVKPGDVICGGAADGDSRPFNWGELAVAGGDRPARAAMAELLSTLQN
jgi:hypothetical protein